MNADLERLIALQQQDLEGKRLRAELLEAPKWVATAEAGLKKSQTALAAAEFALKKEDVLRRQQELDADERRGKIKRLSKQMETATSAAQITALEHEIKFSGDAIRTLEDEEIASMERTEQQDAARTAALAAVETTASKLTVERERAAATTAKDTDALNAVEAERTTLRAAIAENLLAQYDRVSKARGTGVSEGVDHKCSACQMMVRPQRWNDLTDRADDEAVFTCESCGRLLYWDPRRDAPVDWKPGHK
ncbi:MAG: C4-type zinc ribbon domain-containing protein [Acidobacteriaceae bacterium]